MGIRILFDSNEEAAILYDSTTETAFGRVVHGDDAVDCLEAFQKWYAATYEGDLRRNSDPGAVFDKWRASLDRGCSICHANPWNPCDDDEKEDGSQHARTFHQCAGREMGVQCEREGRYQKHGAWWCMRHHARSPRAVQP